MRREVLMPHLAEEVEEGVVVTWFVEPGASVREGDLLAELQVQKVSSELRSPFNGRVENLLVDPGGVVAQGAPIAVIDVEVQAPAVVQPAAPQPAAGARPAREPAAARAVASPASRRLAGELGIDLDTLAGTGPGGRIVEADVRAAAARPSGRPGTPEPAVRVEPLSPMRRAIAERLRSWLNATAQVTLVAEADVTDLEDELRRMSPASRRQASFVEAVVRAAALALRDHRRMGARWSDEGLVYPPRIDIGVAVSLMDGLVTPVVRAADSKDLATLGQEIAGLVERARDGSLEPSDTERAALTVTNLGAYRIDAFTPLLAPPQAAIVGLGRARRRPAVIGEAVVARTLMTLSLTFDHRVVDGAPAAEFLTQVVQLLEQPAARGGVCRT